MGNCLVLKDLDGLTETARVLVLDVDDEFSLQPLDSVWECFTVMILELPLPAMGFLFKLCHVDFKLQPGILEIQSEFLLTVQSRDLFLA